ncbi:MAG: N-acetylmuramoyl-L-alanine amidase [Spongiibacteraceae bacterium]|jgi:N-acetylmuramoyl-L-alanine amidase|nr:N-acetylmuramoyl-L-alanine amidase [Spongiibacteraceae bacterium]
MKTMHGLLVLLLTLLISAAGFAAEVKDVRLWRAPDHTRVVFDLSGPAEYQVFQLNNPERLVVDISRTRLKQLPADLKFDDSPISRLRHGVREGKDLRVVFDLTREVKIGSFMLAASGDLHDRLVIDFHDKQSAARTVKTAVDITSGRRPVIIAIDAGHGGEDPGAIGPGRLYEKKVVLEISKELQRLFNSTKGYKAELVRTGDYYVGLRQRRDIARKMQADLFISVHADAFKTPHASGSSVYALSQRGATSASAAFLAQRENDSDLVGGVSLSDKDDILAGVLTDLSMTASMDASLRIGANVLDGMGRMTKLHSKRVEQAAFAVLKSPDIPSILVETGFISNPGEARKLATSSYRKQMAQAIFSGVDSHFRRSPPPDTYLAALKRGEVKPREYTIASGDTLSEIAARFDVSVAQLQRENKLASSGIRIGQTLIIPES